jgi:hypothetical protein
MANATKPIPRLLYHNLTPILHPSNSDESVLTIRFSSPVRIDAIRIIPEGVNSLTGIGSTYPSQFTARVLFNVSPSNPVNALSTTNITYDGESGWEQDYQIGMPEGISTRMMVIVGKIDRLSLSVYGYGSGTTSVIGHSEEEMDHASIGKVEKEDWSWVSSWAGGINGLLQLLDTKLEPDKRTRALECLELLGEVDVTIYDRLVQHTSAIMYLQALDASSPSSPSHLMQRLYDVPKYALHENLRHRLLIGHRYQPLVDGTEDCKRDAAWALLPDEGALRVLRDVEPGDWSSRHKVSGSSRRSGLIKHLDEWEGSDEGYEIGLDLLLNGIGSEWSSNLVRRVTPLLVRSRIVNHARTIDIPLCFSREVVTVLIAYPSVIDGKSALPTTTALAERYVQNLDPSDPLRTAFQPTAPPVHDGHTLDERVVSRFAKSLQSPDNGYTHSLTPEELLSVLAPELLRSLSTARQPPFGLPPIRGPTHSQTLASASTFAGKVYSSHDFRSRTVTAEAPAAGPMSGGVGLGVSSVRGESRPASRHVDDYLASR